jgi:hypothetical protein
VSFGAERLGQFPIRDNEICLPLGVARVGGGQALADSLALLVGAQGPGELGLDAAHLLKAHREVALPAGVARVLSHQLALYVERLLQDRECLWQVAETSPFKVREQFIF